MAEWQPIETAPKDGSRMLLPFTDANGRTSVIVGGYDNHWTGKCWVISEVRFQRPVDWTPTHWMPLPEPPQS